MRTVAIVQARIGSSRLPGKVLADLDGDTMLARVVGRLRAARTIDDIVIATTTKPSDDAVVARSEPPRRRASSAAPRRRARALHRRRARVRAPTRSCASPPTARCSIPRRSTRSSPCSCGGDGRLRVEHARADLSARPRRRGVLPRHARADRRARRRRRPRRARHRVRDGEAGRCSSIHQVLAETDDSDLRWTVDTAEDLALVRALYAQLGLGTTFVPYREVVAAVRARPELAAINAHITQKTWQDRHVA